jgi:decaprenylphospho-beta-D-erythro-pentofuranosid-2-ulose 2-reductase
VKEPRRVAIMGATSAIAEACARAFAMEGARLFLGGRRAEALAIMASDLKVRGAASVATWAGDLADLMAHPALLEAMQRELGSPEIVLLAWGTLTDQPRAEVEPAYAARELVTNFTAPVALLLGLAPLMPERAGAVIACITSVAGDRGRQSNLVYGAAKGGLQRFLEGLRHRLHPRGIAVLDIRPGFVKTPMTAHLPQGGPLWSTPESIAADILHAIERRRSVLYTPRFWRWVMLVVRALPRPLFHRTSL